MLNGLPRGLLDQGNQRNRNVGDHEQRESEHVEDLLTSRCMDIVPFGKRGKRTEHKHEEREVKEAEEDRGKRRSDHDARGHYAGNAQHGDNRIESDGDDGQQHSRANGHQHVVACETRTLRVGENTLDQLPAISKEHLIKAFCPTEALIPRVAECQRLFVVEHSGRRIGNSTTADDRGSGKFDIFSEHMVLPAAHLIDDLRADKESRARNSAAGSQGKTSLRKVFRLAHEPYGIARGNPVGTVILRVAVAG
ncbi:unknown [Eggerthella sp. CAG:209]|nr:unknown [Eggerthella sp. CAG:209]